ncbi:MAG: GNAT family N-acetyltransferase [Candidatus Obscuribacterales bacterium]|nr:GNAT family N-acetyltransferase [Candidatus Obscuribacterales bacterium]
MDLLFETPRLLVRKLSRQDFKFLHPICSNSEVMKYVGNGKPYEEPQSRQVILKFMRSYAQHGFGGWGLIEKKKMEFAGYGGFEFVPERAMPELFYIFAPDFWGQGFASEFARAAVTYAENELSLTRFGASFDPANLASMRVSAKAGLSYSHEGLDEFQLPTVYYVLDKRPSDSSF